MESKTSGELALIRLTITQLLVDELVAEDDFRHVDAVLRALGRGDRAHERLVGIAQVAVDHVEVALVHRYVDRLADGAAGMMDRRGEIGQLHKIAKILDRGIAAALIEIADEGRTIDRGEHRIVSADDDVAVGVPGKLGEFASARS